MKNRSLHAVICSLGLASMLAGCPDETAAGADTASSLDTPADTAGTDSTMVPETASDVAPDTAVDVADTTTSDLGAADTITDTTTNDLGPADTDTASDGAVDTAGGTAPVGSACSSDGECAGPGTPICLTEYKPIADLIEPGTPPDVAAQFETIGLDFPDGYCSTDGSCNADSDCGTGGSCFWPLENVAQATLDELAAVGLPFDLNVFATLGLCMQACSVTADCRAGYECGVPLNDFLSLVAGATTETFCIGPPPLD